MRSMFGKTQRLYVALYDDSHRELDWALVIVPKSDARPVPATAMREVPQTVWSEPPATLAGGEYGIFRIRSTLDDVAIDTAVSSFDSILLNLAAEDKGLNPPLRAESRYYWEFQQQRVDCPEKDPSLVAMFHVANLSSSGEVARLVKYLRKLPPFPPNTALASDGEYVFVDTNDWGLPSTKDVVTAPAQDPEHQPDLWDSSSWVHRVLDHLRPRHPEMPTAAKLNSIIKAISPKLREHYLDGFPFSYAVRGIDVRNTPNVCVPPWSNTLRADVLVIGLQDCLPHTPRAHYVRAKLRWLASFAVPSSSRY